MLQYNMKLFVSFCLIAVFVCALIIPASAHVSYAAGVPYSEYPAPPEPEYTEVKYPGSRVDEKAETKSFIIIAIMFAAIIFFIYVVSQHHKLSSLEEDYAEFRANTKLSIEKLTKEIEDLKNK